MMAAVSIMILTTTALMAAVVMEMLRVVRLRPVRPAQVRLLPSPYTRPDVVCADRLAMRVAGKLWSTAQFPEGCKGPANWDLANLAAAQDWHCPCSERNCLSRDRFPKPDELYDHRKTFQTTSKGLRDTFRDKVLEPVYSQEKGTFGTVRIGKHNDNCIAAAGLAAGLSFATFANARADVTKSRPHHSGRVEHVCPPPTTALPLPPPHP